METQLHQEFLCPFCKEYVKKTDFDTHKMSHWNDAVNYPETLEHLKTRFQFLGLYDER